MNCKDFFYMKLNDYYKNNIEAATNRMSVKDKL